MRKHYYTLSGFSERLSSAMAIRKINNTELAKMLEIDRKTVSSWVNGYNTPNCVILAELCMILRLSANWLLFGKEYNGD